MGGAWRFVGFLLAVLLVLIGQGPAGLADERRGANYFPNVEVRDQNGRVLHFYDDVLKDKIVVVNFVYTSCKDICPLATARLAIVKDKLGDRMGRSVFFVSMTVDPEVDTPERLKGFSDAFNTGPGWLFLTGKPEDVKLINRSLGDRSTRPSQHRNEIVLGNDATGEWARNSALGDLERLTYDILEMDPVWRDTPRVVSEDDKFNTVLDLNDHPGEALFRKICTPCHTVGVGKRVGPDLRGVTERRSAEWLSRFITDPQNFVKSGDPDAVAIDAAFPNVRMPVLGLSQVDVDDLITYLKTANDKIEEGQETAAHDHTHMHETTSN